ncbi:MAG TPA: hypothetical protein VKG25_04010, partial [Bryobacteraceae bacterium]|nr:hypothetical protein [Bryobacteraceae bacterium]
MIYSVFFGQTTSPFGPGIPAGEPPEAIRSHYPTLSLEQVYGAITFYLGAKEEAEKDIAASRTGGGRVHEDAPRGPPSQGKAGACAVATAGSANLTLTDDPLPGGRHLHEGIVVGCLRREPTMDSLSANEANLEGVPDPRVLA